MKKSSSFNKNALIYKGMSVDQNLLYRSCRAIIDGKCPPDLAQRALGHVSHARWLTLALRVNFLYMTFTSPSFEVYRLAFFVINVYIVYSALWFQSRLKWRATDAPALAFKAMHLIQKLRVDERKILFPVFERGFFYGHSEQLFLGCLACEDPDVRAQAVARIFALRYPTTVEQEPSTSTGRGRSRKQPMTDLRIFKLPKPVYNATHFSRMIDWSTEQVYEPPYLRKFDDQALKAFEKEPLVMSIPNNSQFVERYIQLISKNGTRAASATIRDGLCHATLRSRQQRPKIETKAHFSN